MYILGVKLFSHLQVVRRVFVVRGRVQAHHALEEGLGERVVREQRVAVDDVQLALARRRRAAEQPRGAAARAGAAARVVAALVEAEERV